MDSSFEARSTLKARRAMSATIFGRGVVYPTHMWLTTSRTRQPSQSDAASHCSSSSSWRKAAIDPISSSRKRS